MGARPDSKRDKNSGRITATPDLCTTNTGGHEERIGLGRMRLVIGFPLKDELVLAFDARDMFLIDLIQA